MQNSEEVCGSENYCYFGVCRFGIWVFREDVQFGGLFVCELNSRSVRTECVAMIDILALLF